MPGRFIGIRHRVKQTADQESRPTQVVIAEDGDSISYDLADETAELDWLLGRYPVEFRKVAEGEDLSGFLPHHVIRDKEDHPVRIPAEFDGLKPGDTVAMTLGGSGDPLAYALSRRAEEIVAKVMRIPPAKLKEMRTANGDKNDDASLLAKLVQSQPDLFYKTGPRDRDLIMLRECLRARTDAMKARIGCEQRLRQHFIGMAFCSPDGRYPEGSVEKAFEERKANSIILKALADEEEARWDDLKDAVEALEVYQEIFAPIKGVGPRIAAGIIAGIGDIRRFPTDAKLKAFCGVHVLPDGRMARRRGGEVANWNADIRQSLYLLGDQFNRRPDTRWGQLLREYKAKLRVAHPEKIVENGKSKYSDGHIHKMATWKTLSKFVEWLWREWWKLEEAHKQKLQQAEAA